MSRGGYPAFFAFYGTKIDDAVLAKVAAPRTAKLSVTRSTIQHLAKRARAHSNEKATPGAASTEPARFMVSDTWISVFY